MPDAYYAIGAADMAPYYKAGWALNLKPELDKGWNKNFAPGLLDFVEFKDGNPAGIPPGIYSASWEVNSYGTLYNPAHLEKAGLDPKKAPETTTELLEMSKSDQGEEHRPARHSEHLHPLVRRVSGLELAQGRGDRSGSRRQGIVQG